MAEEARFVGHKPLRCGCSSDAVALIALSQKSTLVPSFSCSRYLIIISALHTSVGFCSLDETAALKETPISVIDFLYLCIVYVWQTKGAPCTNSLRWRVKRRAAAPLPSFSPGSRFLGVLLFKHLVFHRFSPFKLWTNQSWGDIQLTSFFLISLTLQDVTFNHFLIFYNNQTVYCWTYVETGSLTGLLFIAQFKSQLYSDWQLQCLCFCFVVTEMSRNIKIRAESFESRAEKNNSCSR